VTALGGTLAWAVQPTNSMTKPKLKNNTYIHARVSQTVASSLQKYGEDHDRSVSYVIRSALEEYLQSRGYDTAPL
jgi:hypothetical protein